MRKNKIFLKVIDTEVRSETQDWCPIVMRLNYVNRNFHPIKSYNWKLKNQQNSEIFLHFRENFVNILIFLHFWVEIKMDSQFLWREKKNSGKIIEPYQWFLRVLKWTYLWKKLRIHTISAIIVWGRILLKIKKAKFKSSVFSILHGKINLHQIRRQHFQNLSPYHLIHLLDCFLQKISLELDFGSTFM